MFTGENIARIENSIKGTSFVYKIEEKLRYIVFTLFSCIFTSSTFVDTGDLNMNKVSALELIG